MKNLNYKMCKNCELAPVYEFINKRKICKNCFINWFGKKFLYTIRKFDMLSKNDKIYYKKTSNFRNIALEKAISLLSKKGRIKITNKFNANKIALEYTSDNISYKFLELLVKKDVKNINKLFPVYKKYICPFYLFLDKEVLLYANLKNSKIKSKNKFSKFIDKLEINHPEVKFSIVKSLLKLK